ncbi:MAG: hypothetical protein QQN63_11935, partial [Nitrosopumilus sp.]
YRTLTATPLDPGSGVRDALISSGRLELIRSEELRSRLAEWESLVDEVREAVKVYDDFITLENRRRNA